MHTRRSPRWSIKLLLVITEGTTVGPSMGTDIRLFGKLMWLRADHKGTKSEAQWLLHSPPPPTRSRSTLAVQLGNGLHGSRPSLKSRLLISR